MQIKVDSSVALVSQMTQDARKSLLEAFQNQLDTLISEQLTPNDNGVPFTHFEKDAPQIISLKKVINCLYHAEEGFKHQEMVNFADSTDILKGSPQLAKALLQINKAVTMLDDASPEIRAVIANNYNLLAPIFNITYELVEKSGWFSSFIKMDATDKASKVIEQAIDIFGSDVNKWNDSNPLIATFATLAKVIKTVSELNAPNMPEKETENAVALIRLLLIELENNAFLKKLSISDFEGSKAINDLLFWFKNIQENDFDFTRKSMKQYVVWANEYLPSLILLSDQLERQNYLKPGILSDSLCSGANSLSSQINELLSDPILNINEQVNTLDSIKLLREQQIAVSQVTIAKEIMVTEKQQIALAAFFQILEAYKGKSYSEIIEDDRILLRQVYSKVQFALAHANLDVENQFTSVLNTTGPVKIIPQPRTWGKLFTDGLGYVASYVVNPEVTKLLETRQIVAEFISNHLSSEHFKLALAEKARIALINNVDNLNKDFLKDIVAVRLNNLKTILNKEIVEAEIPAQFIPVNPEQLVNLRGMLTTIQKLKLSETISETRHSLAELVNHHLPAFNKYFSYIPYVITEDEPELVSQIKQIDINLAKLEEAVKCFERIYLSYGVVVHLMIFIDISSAASALKSSLTSLSPESQKALAPLLKQITAYTASFSDIKTSDLASLEQLKNNKMILANPVSEELKPKLGVLDYAQKIAVARAELLIRLKTTLANPLVLHLNEQETGVPFLNVENDPPQLAAIKKMMNSLYYAEIALKIGEKIDLSSNTATVAAVHQGVVALSQVYKSFALFTELTPEVQSVLFENYDLIQPIINGAKDLIDSSGWGSQFKAMNVSIKLGSVLGQGINMVQPETGKGTRTASLVKLLTEIPTLISNINSAMSSNDQISLKKLKLKKDKIESIGAIFELIFEENASIFNSFKGLGALSGLIDLNNKIQREGMNLQDTTLALYQEWVEAYYPDLMMMIDEIETRNYLKPGLLSNPISLEIDRVNDRLNAIIEDKPESKLKEITLSFYMEHERTKKLLANKSIQCNELFVIDDQQKEARHFFYTLKQYPGQQFNEILPVDRIALRRYFATIQVALANTNLDLTNQLATIFNQSGQPNSKSISINQLIELEYLVRDYLTERQKSCRLKINVVDHAIEHVKSKSFDVHKVKEIEPTIGDLQVQYLLEKRRKSRLEPVEFKIISSSSVHNVRGNLAYIQNLKVSSTIAVMREQLISMARTNFSGRIQEYLNIPTNLSVHIINDDDPMMVKQVKQIENSLYYLETSFVTFEKINKNDGFLSQGKALFEIAYTTRQLNSAVLQLTPEIKSQYAPVINKMIDFSNKIQAFEYNQEDVADLGYVLQSIRKEMLEKNKPRDPRIAQAFFDAGVRPIHLNNDSSETASKKAAKLGVKYMHLASPMIEKARSYLEGCYKKVFGDQPSIIHSLTRDQLANEEFMRVEIERLKSILDNNYGFNVATTKVILDLVSQIQRVGVQAGALAGMANSLVTNDFLLIKEKAYEELLTELSKEEDYLCLRPGTLINPAMAAVNQIFLSAALELDMHFIKKLAILDEASFVKILFSQTEKDIQMLLEQKELEPKNHEIYFKIDIKNDKLDHLRRQIALYEKNDVNKTIDILLDVQFDISLRDHLISTSIRAPILQEYEKEVRNYYIKNKANLIVKSDCSEELNDFLKEFELNNIANYLLVYEAYEKLHKFCLKLPEKNQDVKNYIIEINKELTNPLISIEQRALKVQALPYDQEFIGKLSIADEGTGFLKKFKQMVELITSSILESLITGKSVVQIYKQKKMDQVIHNIEKSMTVKDEFRSMKEEEELSEEKNISNSQLKLA